MAILEGRWDCSSCGRVANMGHDVHCCGCGKPRGAVTFYLPDDAEELVDKEKLAEAEAGPDWVCAYCGASNRSTSAHCTGCGAAGSEGKARVVGGGDEQELSAAQIAARDRHLAHHENPTLPSHRVGVAIAMAFFIVFVCGGTGMLGFTMRWGGEKGYGGPSMRFGAPSAGAWVTVKEKHATRSVAIEAQRMVEDSTWCSSMPGDAHELRRTTRQDGTRCEWTGAKHGATIAAAGFFGTKNLGNGYFEKTPTSSGGSTSSGGGTSSGNNCRHIPVYRDWCTWQAQRWVKVRVPENSADDKVPDWPAFQLAPGEREGPHVEEFLVDVQTSDGELIHTKTSEAGWIQDSLGQKRAATFSWFGGMKSVGEPLR
jgi:hypothetical protein